MKKGIIVCAFVAVILGVVFTVGYFAYKKDSEPPTFPTTQEATAEYSTAVDSSNLIERIEETVSVENQDLMVGLQSLADLISTDPRFEPYFTVYDIITRADTEKGATTIYLSGCHRAGYTVDEIPLYSVYDNGEAYDYEDITNLMDYLTGLQGGTESVEGTESTAVGESVEDASKADLYNSANTGVVYDGYSLVDTSTYDNVEEYGVAVESDVREQYGDALVDALKSVFGDIDKFADVYSFLNARAPYLGNPYVVTNLQQTGGRITCDIQGERFETPMYFKVIITSTGTDIYEKQ